jgi:hypothetical protein
MWGRFFTTVLYEALTNGPKDPGTKDRHQIERFWTSSTDFMRGFLFSGHYHRTADCPGHGISSSQGDRAQGSQDQGEQRFESGYGRIWPI